jgi:DNA repair exonuclease SbcCD ATPase subunit
MRVIHADLQNFSSYKSLEFDFSKQGLSLVQGATGSGKSTLCDAVPWVLFGHTSKGGAVDEVLSWPGDLVTKGIVVVETCDELIEITRIRGRAKDNDLYYSISSGPVTRGKDLNDTQKLINNLLEMNCELYLSGAYYHEFSQTAQFFTTTAKNRRTICEQLVDLSLAKKLQVNSSAKRKSVLADRNEVTGQISTLELNIRFLQRMQESEKTKAADWEIKHVSELTSLGEVRDKWDLAKIADIKKLSEHSKETSVTCSECGATVSKTDHVASNNRQIDKLLSKQNPYAEQVDSKSKEKNPHTGSVKDFSDEIKTKTNDVDLAKIELKYLNLEISDLDTLVDVVNDFRGLLIKNTISDIETTTNDILSKYFDAEIRVGFSVEDADKLDVEIFKDGNNCVFTQLSKGQRQLLKLSFGISVMKAVANHHGIHFNQIFFDEAFDGLDEKLKVKAYSLLESLSAEYESVFVVEHSEALKSMFVNKFSVELVNGESQITHG